MLAAPLSTAFWACYLGGGISDLLEGALARWLKTKSAAGAKLDSAADLVFAAAIMKPFFHNTFHSGQANTAINIPGCLVKLGGESVLKNPGKVFLRYSRPIITDADHIVVLDLASRNYDTALSAFKFNRFHRIVHKIL